MIFGNDWDSFTNAVEQLKGMDIKISSDMLVVLILKSLPPSFENFRCAIRSNDELPTTEALIGKILDENRSRRSVESAEDNNVLYAGNRYGRKPQQRKFKSKNSKPCFICGKIGHWAAKCPERQHNSARSVESSEETHYVVDQPEEAHNVTSRSRWCLDSGCTTHMCTSDEFLTDIQECEMTLNMANAASTKARAKGLAHIKADTGNIDLNLRNTLLVKDLRTNLISVSKITRNDREILFRKDDAIVRDLNGEVKLVADRVGDLYYLREQAEQVKAVEKESERTSTSDLDLWHARLGHLHMDAVVNLSKGQASGIKLLKKDTTLCDVCHRGKLTVKPFYPRAEKSQRMLEIVHTDLCQPSGTKSEGGNRYFVTFIDDYSSWCELYLLKSKDGVFEAFKTYKNYVEKQTGLKIKALQSDNGREYCNKQFDEYLRHEGIKKRLTVPYTPQQNGVAERMNRTIVDMARCLLIQAGFPTMYWGAAITTANYLRNRCPSRSHGGSTPFELWFGRKPELKHLRVFGAKVLVLRKEIGRQKLEERSIEGRLVGYYETAKAYRVRRNDDDKVVITRDVQIIEENVMRSRSAVQLDVEYTHPQEEDPEPGRVLRDRRSCREIVREPSPARARGRPKKQKSGKPGRPRKLYRYVSASSITSSRASSRENLSQEEEEAPEEDDEEASNDVFIPSAVDEVLRTKRPLESSLFQEDKRPRNDRSSSDSEKSPKKDEDNTDEGDEFMDAKFIEELALMADVELEEAIRGTESTEWKCALAAEVRSHLEHGTWDLVECPENGKIIGSKVILKNKLNVDGKIERRKARIVARGFSQRPGFDFDETFAPVARLESIRLLEALSTKMDAKIHQMDVETAYLHAKVDEELYMEVPGGSREALVEITRSERRDSEVQIKALKILEELTKGVRVCKLRKSIYGLKQSGKK
ncbi:GSCOCG00012493001-RA-CDS [Cotesia congregata]|nr:GSCOCG00012493001-RA-CDS [Cotesia congregata]